MPLETTCPSLELLRRSLDPDATMTDSERQRIDAHVDGCQQGCKEVITALLQGNSLGLHATVTPSHDGTQPSSPPALASPPPVVPGYEILGELGRGGMAVVYKARHLALNRLVALKMILTGSLAGPEERLRFLAEAEAVAAVKHTGIVQIHDFGTHEGVPFLSLEFCGGGSLAGRLAEGPLPAREAARLIVQVAQAVQAAHDRGIVHRDLKPGNILLVGGEWSEGTPAHHGPLIPKVTDFGLAKRVEVSGLTTTGAVLGTPSYMAPEQARGSKEVGKAADVYALGAVLYDCLTGRPPFKAAQVYDTIVQVVNDEPAPPRQLNPQVPRDLETVCLKCLAKEPARRYESAQALAEEVRRFQAGQPIRARPVAWPERLVKWVKRRPAVATLAAAVVLLGLAALVTSWVLTGWALHERDQASARLAEAQQAERRRVHALVEQLLSAAPEAVPGILAALQEDAQAIRPRLRIIWADSSVDRQRRMRAALALLGDEPSLREPLADWMIETDGAREMMLARHVLSAHGPALADRLWKKVDDPKALRQVRFRALVALAEFDRASPRWRQAGPMAAEMLLRADPRLLDFWIPALKPVRDPLNDRLIEVFRGKDKHQADRRLAAAAVLAEFAADRPVVLADLACDADAGQYKALKRMLTRNVKGVRAALAAELGRKPAAENAEADRVARATRQGRAAATLVALGEPDAAWPVLRRSRTPDARTVLIHALAPRGADPRILIRRLQKEKDASTRAALILALGEYTAEQLPLEVRAALTPKLLSWYRIDPDPGVHGAIDWLLRHGKEGPIDRPLDWGGRADLEKIDRELSCKPGRRGQRWYVNGQGQTLIAIRGPVEFSMGSPASEPDRSPDEAQHLRKIPRSYALAARPVTVAEFQRFLQAYPKIKKQFDAGGRAATLLKKFSPEADGPIVYVDWYMAVAYCNWLSQQEGIPETEWVYPTGPDAIRPGLTMPAGYLGRTGYRLPTESEWEHACRAETLTSRYYGAEEEMLPRYAWYLHNARTRAWPVGQKKPNDFGLFDMHGNVLVWCQDRHGPYPESGPDKHRKDAESSIVRGGSFGLDALYVRSAYRAWYPPAYRYDRLGFRPARTLPLDHFAVLPAQ
jgi:formylglycine-generating enzyme required for sulfatase activity/tRNA A-37 threonylcarbamoyl transferase component Bud32